MPMDYDVFIPSDEHLAQIIVSILERRGYNAGYQIGYPNNKIFIKVDTKEEADRISEIIRKFMKKFSLTERGITTSKLNTLTSKLGSLIPEKREKPAENIEKKKENNDSGTSEISENDIYHNVKLEEWRSKVVERLNFLNTLMAETPNDPSNEKRKIESDTLVWVLQNMQ
jgi:hypothetical protein